MAGKENRQGHGDLLVYVRNEVISDLWSRVFRNGGFHGRTWGPQGQTVESRFRGSHVLLGTKDGELVIINEGPNGQLLIHEFSETENTKLGQEIRERLEKARLI